MSERVQNAVDYHKKGYNCAQAVLCSYSDLYGLDEKTAFMISEGFGRGMGGMRDGSCGAVSAMCMLAGIHHSSGDPSRQTRQKTYQKTQKLCAAFKERNGSILCVDLLGLGASGLKTPCAKCIQDAAQILEELLEQEE